jgi:signal transduction histidine kinase
MQLAIRRRQTRTWVLAAVAVVLRTGPGIEPEQLARIFDRPYTRSVSPGGGCGVGPRTLDRA